MLKLRSKNKVQYYLFYILKYFTLYLITTNNIMSIYKIVMGFRGKIF